MSRWRKRIDRIKAEVPITQVLADLGYDVRPDGGDREQQFPCDLHGDGQDHKPSGRVYPESHSFYCFACDKSRDAVEIIREKLGLDFKEALKYLEQKYNLPPLPWEDDGSYTPKPKLTDEVLARLHPGRTFADDQKVLHSRLRAITIEQSLPMDVVLPFWEALDAVTALVKQKQATEEKGRQALAKINAKVTAAEQEEPE